MTPDPGRNGARPRSTGQSAEDNHSAVWLGAPSPMRSLSGALRDYPEPTAEITVSLDRMARKSRWFMSPAVRLRLSADRASTGARAEERNRYRWSSFLDADDPASFTYRFTNTLVSK